MHQNTSTLPKKRVLVAVLNWGLGHAARCIPLISALQAAGHHVLLAADGRAGKLLQKEFPVLEYVELPAYNIRYGSSNMILNIAWQWPKIIFTAWQEHQKMKVLIDQYQLDLVISDSRFGCFNSNIKSIFITHQLWIKTPMPSLSFLVNKLNHLVIRRFDECWVPDRDKAMPLAGDLSRPIPNQVHRYLGILSRMTPELEENTLGSHSIVAILSGPEPQRSRFEELIIAQAKDLDQPLLLIQGKAEVKAVEKQEGQITIQSFASGPELNAILLHADLILCRSGYSSLMDLVSLNKRAILVPTPGQTEQEYLAKLCLNRGWFYSQPQHKFDLQEAIEASERYHPDPKLKGVKNRLEELKAVVNTMIS